MGKTIQIMIDKCGCVTNGDVVMAMFPKYKFERCKDFGVVQMILYSDNDDAHLIFITEFDIAWWDSPYKESDKNAKLD